MYLRGHHAPDIAHNAHQASLRLAEVWRMPALLSTKFPLLVKPSQQRSLDNILLQFPHVPSFSVASVTTQSITKQKVNVSKHILQTQSIQDIKNMINIEL